MPIVMIIVGAILLLPGLCAGVFLIAFGFDSPPRFPPDLVTLWLLCFAIAAGGFFLIRAGVRARRERQQQAPTQPPE